jgi:hypothetical protein
MKRERFYFVVFREKDAAFGLNVFLYPHLSLWIRLPFVEIRFGVELT